MAALPTIIGTAGRQSYTDGPPFCSTGPARPSLRGRGHVAAGQAPAVVAALYVDHGRAVENRAAEIGSGHGGVAEIRTPEISAVQVRIAEVGTDQDGAN